MKNTVRRALRAAAALLAVAVLIPVLIQPAAAATLNVLNWSEYLPYDIIEDFEREFGIQVNYDAYSSNEEMLAKLLAGGLGIYDLAVPSDYMVAVMVAQNVLEPIDHDKVPNLRHIGAAYLNPPFDPGNQYSLPYMWGTTGIAYNVRYVTEPVTSWNDLWNPAYRGRVVLVDDSRDVIGSALQALGYSRNETDPARLEEARRKLQELRPNVLAYDSANPKTFLATEEAWIALVWNGDAVMAMAENPDIRYVLPEEGGSIWQDNLVIPRGAPNRAAAHAFIDFLYRPEVSARLAMAFPYGTPNEAARELLPPSLRDNPVTYPDPEVLARAEWQVDVGRATVLYDRIFTEIKR